MGPDLALSGLVFCGLHVIQPLLGAIGLLLVLSSRFKSLASGIQPIFVEIGDTQQQQNAALVAQFALFEGRLKGAASVSPVLDFDMNLCQRW